VRDARDVEPSPGVWSGLVAAELVLRDVYINSIETFIMEDLF
jgi:hypothetical protein